MVPGSREGVAARHPRAGNEGRSPGTIRPGQRHAPAPTSHLGRRGGRRRWVYFNAPPAVTCVHLADGSDRAWAGLTRMGRVKGQVPLRS